MEFVGSRAWPVVWDDFASSWAYACESGAASGTAAKVGAAAFRIVNSSAVNRGWVFQNPAQLGRSLVGGAAGQVVRPWDQTLKAHARRRSPVPTSHKEASSGTPYQED
jgi:hypothetical protein